MRRKERDGQWWQAVIFPSSEWGQGMVGRVVDDSEPLVSTELPSHWPSFQCFSVCIQMSQSKARKELFVRTWWVVCGVVCRASGMWVKQISPAVGLTSTNNKYPAGTGRWCRVHLTFPLYGSISGRIWDCPPDCPHITLTAAQLQICKMQWKEVKLITLYVDTMGFVVHIKLEMHQHLSSDRPPSHLLTVCPHKELSLIW